MRVRDVMSTEVKSVEAALPADEAWRWMRAERIHHLVVRDGAAIAGVISDRVRRAGRCAPVTMWAS
jgi:CBS domain-containing protein